MTDISDLDHVFHAHGQPLLPLQPSGQDISAELAGFIVGLVRGAYALGHYQTEFVAMNKFVILDRDGVINRITRGEYITSPEMIELLPGAARGIALLNAAGYSVVVVSNQQCVALGLLTSDGLDIVSESLRSVLRGEDARIEAFFYCTHLKTAACECRKPQPGLLLEAQRRFGFDLSETYFVGDMYSDVMTAKNAGCRSIFTLGGLDDELHRRGEPFPHAPEYVARDLGDAAAYILSRECTG